MQSGTGFAKDLSHQKLDWMAKGNEKMFSHATATDSASLIRLPVMPVPDGTEDHFSGDDPQRATTREGLWRLLSTTIAILNQTHRELDKAHRNIGALEERIARLEALASTDPTTGLKNRRGFEDAFAQELDRVKRGLSQGGVMVMLDLDNFKAINDGYSHQAGDACLKLVGTTLASHIRGMDTASRLGGDEFVLLLTDTGKEQVLERIQAMIWQLNHLSLLWNSQEIPVRASIGLREYGKGDRAEQIYRDVDQAMYRSKADTRTAAEGRP